MIFISIICTSPHLHIKQGCSYFEGVNKREHRERS
jgi:hypothetical protein